MLPLNNANLEIQRADLFDSCSSATTNAYPVFQRLTSHQGKPHISMKWNQFLRTQDISSAMSLVPKVVVNLKPWQQAVHCAKIRSLERPYDMQRTV